MKTIAILMLALVTLTGACGKKAAPVSGGPTTTTEGDAAAFLASMRKATADASFKVTYEIGGSSSGPPTTITWAQMPPKSSYRIGSGSDTTLMIDLGDGTGTIMCTDSCVRFGKDQPSPVAGLLAPLFAFRDLIGSAQDLPGFSAKSGETIAGRAAQCASWTLGGAFEGCVDKETGIVLRWAAGGASASGSMTATAYGEPTASDFEPTSKVEEMPSGYPGGYPS